VGKPVSAAGLAAGLALTGTTGVRTGAELLPPLLHATRTTAIAESDSSRTDRNTIYYYPWSSLLEKPGIEHE
jgi:hypothetical protein